MKEKAFTSRQSEPKRGSVDWLLNLEDVSKAPSGLEPVQGYRSRDYSTEEFVIMERAEEYGAQYVFFSETTQERPPIAEAFIYIAKDDDSDVEFAKLHQRLWSWGQVPLVYRKSRGLLQIFRCAHKYDFFKKGKYVCEPVDKLKIVVEISVDLEKEPWWDYYRIRNRTLWDEPKVCKKFLLSEKASARYLIKAIANLRDELIRQNLLPEKLQKKLIVLAILTAYLEEREILNTEFFTKIKKNCCRFIDVLPYPKALIDLFDKLKKHFNGNVFDLSNEEKTQIYSSDDALRKFAEFVEAKTDPSGQLNLWELYSFRDLPVEVISQVYQLFVEDEKGSVYTPPFLVRLMLDEALESERIDKLIANNQIILDPACGSGVFLVEAFKRLVLHWRKKHSWENPQPSDLHKMLGMIHGIDRDPGAVELAAFSLCIALCDTLDRETIRKTEKLFPPLMRKNLHHSCFFEAKLNNTLPSNIGVVVGNPPFVSKLESEGVRQCYENYNKKHKRLPDKQLAYLFLHESAEILESGGLQCMLQPSGFLYNGKVHNFRRDYFKKYDVREILDFCSVRGIFKKSGKDVKVVIIVTETSEPKSNRNILHATFRRSGRIVAEQGFDIDYYDFHHIPRQLILENDDIWKANLVGGGHVFSFVKRLREYRTLEEYVKEMGWDYGEGFIAAGKGKREKATHITGKPLLPTESLTTSNIHISHFPVRKTFFPLVNNVLFKSPYTSLRFTPPILLIKEHEDLPHVLWKACYLTYKDKIVGISASQSQVQLLEHLHSWLIKEKNKLIAFIAATSSQSMNDRATAILKADIDSIPIPENWDLDLSDNEQIIVDDIIDYYKQFVREGQNSEIMKKAASQKDLDSFTEVFCRQINPIYNDKLKPLAPQRWPGIICQPFVFGDGEVDWSGADELRDKLDVLLKEKSGVSINITRIARIYDGHFLFLLKPNRLRFWLKSVALIDFDDMIADLWGQ